MNQLEYILSTLNTCADKRLMFGDAIRVKSSPHNIVFTCYGACIGPDGVYLMDGEENWHGPLDNKQANGSLVIGSIWQRLKALELKQLIGN